MFLLAFKSLVHYSYPRGPCKLKQFEQITLETQTLTGSGSPRGQEPVPGNKHGTGTWRLTSRYLCPAIRGWIPGVLLPNRVFRLIRWIQLITSQAWPNAIESFYVSSPPSWFCRVMVTTNDQYVVTSMTGIFVFKKKVLFWIQNRCVFCFPAIVFYNQEVDTRQLASWRFFLTTSANQQYHWPPSIDYKTISWYVLLNQWR